MVDQPTKVREVAWNELFPWLMLLQTVRIALMARVLVLGALGLLATMLGWWLLAEVFTRSDDRLITSWPAATNLRLWDDFWIDITNRSAFEVFASAVSNLIQAPVAIWLYLTRPFIELFDGDLTPTSFLFLMLCGVWELLVWGVIGGAITRIAALKFTRDEAPGPVAAVKHAVRKLPSYSLPPLVALAGAAVFAIQLVIVGLAMRLDFLALVAAILWPLALLLGLMMAILLIGALVGWPLMWATVSVEGTDAFDALSRSYAYTYHRPFRLLWYVLFAALLAIVSMFVVKLFAASAIALADWSVDWGLDEATMQAVVTPDARTAEAPEMLPPEFLETPPLEGPDIATAEETPPAEPREPGSMLRGARRAVYFWKSMVAALAAGYQAGFLWVAAVGVYLLMRRDIDGVQLNEVYIDPADEYGMPPLADEATSGVPEVAPGQPAPPGDTGLA